MAAYNDAVRKGAADPVATADARLVETPTLPLDVVAQHLPHLNAHFPKIGTETLSPAAQSLDRLGTLAPALSAVRLPNATTLKPWLPASTHGTLPPPPIVQSSAKGSKPAVEPKSLKDIRGAANLASALTGISRGSPSMMKGALGREDANISVLMQSAREKPTSRNKAGTYTSTIKWGIRNINVRPQGPGFWGERVSLTDPAADAYELQINPNGESYYLAHPKGGFVQFENFTGSTLEDGKLVTSLNSFYMVFDRHEFAQRAILAEGTRQLEAASVKRLVVEWLVSEQKAAEQLKTLFKSHGIPILVTYLPARKP